MDFWTRKPGLSIIILGLVLIFGSIAGGSRVALVVGVVVVFVVVMARMWTRYMGDYGQ
jgi:uncharacterized membrane protein YjdF